MNEEQDSRDIRIGDRPATLLLGQGPLALEVVTTSTVAKPGITTLREMFKERQGRRAAPVLVVAHWGQDRAAVYGPTEYNPIEALDLPAPAVRSVYSRALEADDRHAAIRTLHQLLPQLETSIPGLRNGGLFAMQELENGVPQRGDWGEATDRGRRLRGLRGRALIEGLEFILEEVPGPALLLRARDRKTAVAVLLERPGQIDAASDRFDGMSPVAYALAQADRENLDFVMVVAGSTIRLYPVQPGVGPGRRGRSETFVELNLDILPDEAAGYLWLLLSAGALAGDGSFQQILERSEDYAAELGSNLRDRVYEEVIPRLSRAVVAALGDEEPDQEELERTYQVALRILYRLLFLAYAEDRDLLPLHTSRAYREHSLKRMAQRLAEARRRGVEFGDEAFYWSEVRQVWRAVSRGHAEWEVPAYNGSLFAADAATSPLGALIEEISIPDRAFAPALAELLLDDTQEGEEGPVDFRSLGVREFGTIYEGLLESELSLAETDLKVDPTSNAYLPAGPDDEVEVAEGDVYLHDRSGARRATGSYYTKSFAVEHLLDRALEPALDEHLGRLDEMSEREAGRRFFEFRVADIAMGSGHFLVAAVDRIERRLVSYLARRVLPDVKEELGRLRRTAMENLGEDWAGDAIDDAQLLRRQVARRCIFGVDLNPMAVELARVSIWIHTFVPGLPLSLLDQNLIQGNSLVGIATFEEAAEILHSGGRNLYSAAAAGRLERAREPLDKLALLTDASDAEIKEARELYAQVRRATSEETDLFTILTAARTNEALQKESAWGNLATQTEDRKSNYYQDLLRLARQELAGLEVLHFPLAFPHVFLRERGGFDVILGNPPWEQPMVKENNFWAMHFPGYKSQSQGDAEGLRRTYYRDRPDLVRRLEREKAGAQALRRFLMTGNYPGMERGHPDLYQAFVWRFWHLVSPDGGRIGVVLPRSALATKGSGDFRKAILREAESVDLTMLLNSGRWVFEMEARYTIGLAAITRRDRVSRSRLHLSGPYSSLEQFREGLVQKPTSFYGSEVETWNDDAMLPLLPSQESVSVFAQLRTHPRLDLDEPGSFRVRPIQGDLNATTDKPLMDLEAATPPPGFWPVFKGESFDLWAPDTGTYYGWADPDVLLPHLQAKRERATSRSAFAEFEDSWRQDPDTLPCLAPRVAFRDISRATDTRTIRAALLPGRVFLTNKAPYFLWPRGDESDEAYLLGVLSSRPLDWYARRFVETTVNFFILNPFPVPRPAREDALRRRTVALAGRLAACDERFADWARAVGVECGQLSKADKQDYISELDAVVALLYGLTAEHLTHIFETFHTGWDYERPMQATLEHYHGWKSRL